MYNGKLLKMKENDEEIIIETYSPWQASLIRNLLEEYGIFCRFIKELPDVLPFTLDGLGKIRIAVKKEDADRAKRLLQDFEKKIEKKQKK